MSEMRPSDSDRAAHGANDIRSGPDPRVRDSGSPADCAAGRLAYLAQKNSWQGQRTGSAAGDYDFKFGGREGFLGAA